MKGRSEIAAKDTLGMTSEELNLACCKRVRGTNDYLDARLETCELHATQRQRVEVVLIQGHDLACGGIARQNINPCKPKFQKLALRKGSLLELEKRGEHVALR